MIYTLLAFCLGLLFGAALMSMCAVARCADCEASHRPPAGRAAPEKGASDAHPDRG
jgi:hypothetical protein